MNHVATTNRVDIRCQIIQWIAVKCVVPMSGMSARILSMFRMNSIMIAVIIILVLVSGLMSGIESARISRR